MTNFDTDMLFHDEKIKKIANIFCQLCDVIDFMHNAGIAHRDLKPENILLVNNDEKPIIVDFDLAFVMNNITYPSYNDFCGSPGYLAPELWEDCVDYTTINYKNCDIYSFGVMLYRVLNSMKMPYNVSNLIKLYNSILKDLPTESNCGIKDLDNLIMKLIDKNPSNRPSIKETRLILEKYK